MRRKNGNRRGSKPQGKPRADEREEKRDYRDKRDDKRDERKERLSPLNDINWYNKNPALLSAVSKLPFPYRPGMGVPIANGPGNTAPVNYTVPGIIKLTWVPYLGTTTDMPTTDPVNIAAREIFNRVRSSFSGSIDADAPDFMVYFMALDSIFSYIGYLKRIFRIIGAYTPDNHAIPDRLLYAFFTGTNTVDQLRREKMKLFQYINELVHMTDKFVCPALFDIFNRHYWLSDNVYADAATLNSQMYVFAPNRLFTFRMINIGDATNQVMAGGLAWAPIPTEKATNDTDIVDTLYNYGTNLINALSAWDDAFIISGYLRRAFEGAPAFRVDEVGYNEEFTPVYVPEVLQQIENAYTAIPWQMTISLTNVVQDPTNNTLKTNVAVTPVTSAVVTLNPFLNIRGDIPSEEQVVEASRLQTYWDDAKQQIVAGTELLMEISVNGGAGNYYTAIPSLAQYNVASVNADSVVLMLQLYALLESFDWHPFVYTAELNTVANETWLQRVNVFGDTHNYTTFTYEMARQLNRVCLFSEFNAFGID